MCKSEVVQDMSRFEVVQDMSRFEVVQDMCRFDRAHCSQAKGKKIKLNV